MSETKATVVVRVMCTFDVAIIMLGADVSMDAIARDAAAVVTTEVTAAEFGRGIKLAHGTTPVATPRRVEAKLVIA